MGFLENLSELGGEALGEGKLIVGVDSAPLAKGMDQIGETVKTKANGWGAAFKVAQIGLIAFTTAFVGFAVEGVKKADELDAAVARISAQVGLLPAQTAKMRAGLLDMSTRTQQPVDELAKSIESVAKAGYNVDDSLRIQEASARVATVTHAELGTVTNTVVTAMKAWNISAKDVGKVTDTLITTVGRSRIDFDALSRIIATAAPIAKDAGVSFNDLNAAIIAVGRSGIPARRASAGVIALIRSLSSPTAQKEMKLLGLTVNATTIAHDGLLATLQRISAASGKHISVLVKTKAVHVDLTKATERLRVAELRLEELRKKTKVSGSTMLSAENRVADARRALNALQAKATSGGIDYAKSAAATTKANSGQLQVMQAMVGGASGLVTADILLANGAKDYKDGQDALNKSLGKTNEEFDKVKEADLSIQLALIRNQITRFAIDLGTNLLPYVAKFLSWMTVAVPNALRAIGDLWNNTLREPVTAMVRSFLDFAGAIKDALFGTGDAGTGATSFFKGLATILVDIVKDVGGIFDVFTNILKLPFVKALAPFVALAGVLRVASSLLPAIARALTGKALGALNFATGGIFKLGGAGAAGTGEAGMRDAAVKTSEAATKTTEAAAKTSEAAVKLSESSTESATKLGESAGKLAEAALKISEGSSKALFAGEVGAVAGGEGFNAAEAIRNQTYVESTIAVNESTQKVNERTLAADSATVKADDSTIATNTEQQIVQQAQKVVLDDQLVTNKLHRATLEEMAAAVKTGQETALGVVEENEAARTAIARETAAKAGLGIGGSFAAGEALAASGGGRIKGALGSAGGLIGGVISKAIVPILVAQLASDIAKAPIGDFVSNTLGLHEVGAKIKEDFFGGMVDWAKTVLFSGGSDAWVGKAEDTTIGNAHIKTMELAKLGVTAAQIDDLQSTDPKVSLPAQFDEMTNLQAQMQRKAGETVNQWFDRLTAIMGDGFKSATIATLAANDTGAGHYGTAEYEAAITPLLQASVTRYINDRYTSLGTSFTSVVGGILAGRPNAAFTAGSASGLDTATSTLITRLSAAGEDQYGFLLDFVAAKALGKIGGKIVTPNARAGGRPVGPDAVVTARLAGEALRGNIVEAQKQFNDALNNLPSGQGEAIRSAMKEFAAQTSNVDPGIAQALAKRFGAHWQEALRTGTETFAAAPDKAEAARLAKALGRNWKAILLSIGEGSATPETIKATEAKMKKAFGANWKSVFAGAVSGTTDQATVKEMVRLFGPGWKSALGQFGTLLWQSEGGKDYDALLAGLKTYAATLAGDLSGIDFSTPVGTKGTRLVGGRKAPSAAANPNLSPAEEKAARAAVAAAVAKSIKDGTLEMAASPDVAKAKGAIATLGTDWAKAIPNPAARDRFISQMVAWEKMNMTPTNTNLFDALPTLPAKLDALSSAIDRMASSVAAGYLALEGGAAPKKPTQSGGSGKTTKTASAAGGIFDVNSVNRANFGNMEATIGEAGGEEVAVVSHPRSVGWADLMGGGVGPKSSARLPGMKSRGPSGGGSGPAVQMDVEHLHVTSAADEQAILDTFEFMAPGGIA